MTEKTSTKSSTSSKSPNSSAGNRNGTNSTKKGGRPSGGGKGGNPRYRNRNTDKAESNSNKNVFRGQLQSGILKNVVITENTNKRPTQYRKMFLALPTFCAEQKFGGLDEIVRTMTDWDEATYYTKRPDVTEYAEKMKIKVADDEAGQPIVRERMVVTDPEKKEELMETWNRRK